MRWHIIRTLLHKEVLRHWANRGGIILVVLLIVASMLLSFFGRDEAKTEGFFSGVKLCYIDYWEQDLWVHHLRTHIPPELEGRVYFRQAGAVRRNAKGTIVYPQSTGAIQIRNGPQQQKPMVWLWHPGSTAAALAPYEIWFWKETHRFAAQQANQALAQISIEAKQSAGIVEEVERKASSLKGGLDPRSGIATSLVMFGLFFVCVYLMPSLTCEERERGVLLAQALSPASPKEILAAKFLFYPVLALLLAVTLAGTYEPSVLSKPFFWFSVLVSVCGSMGIGLTIASIARTQRAASMGAMCYMLVVALFLFICQQSNIRGLPYLALEYHCPRILHAVMGDAILWYHWWNLLGAAMLACIWAVVATLLFRRCGWQT